MTQPLLASTVNDDPEEEEIILVETNEGGLPGSRGNNPIPIRAVYNSCLEAIGISFYANIGEVTITITNCYTGDTVTAYANSQIGSTVIPISGATGSYSIVFHTESGAVYSGCFIVN